MFLMNVGSRIEHLHQLDGLEGVVLLASARSHERFRRGEVPPRQWCLFDPQLYLATLDLKRASKACARLATHPWFDVAGRYPEFDSAEQRLDEWEHYNETLVGTVWDGQVPKGDLFALATSAIDIQIVLGASHCILPAPLNSDRDDEGGLLADWTDAGIQAADQLDVALPLLATVAVAESALNDAAFEPGGYLDTLVDQITARSGLHGAYVVILQSEDRHPFQPPDLVTRAYLGLTVRLREQGMDVICNFADVFGFTCLGRGAVGFAAGPSRSHRRLCFSGFDDKPGGLPKPRFYSHRLIAELHPESDLVLLEQKKMLSRVRDRTPFSADLLDAVGGRKPIVAGWRETPNNVTFSRRHFLQRMILEEKKLRGLSDKNREAAVRSWLQTAVANQLILENKQVKVQGEMAPAAGWLEAFEEYDASDAD